MKSPKTRKRGRRVGSHPIPEKYYTEITRRAKNELLSSIAKDFDVSPTTIGRIVKKVENRFKSMCR
jgi:hypothetical protein